MIMQTISQISKRLSRYLAAVDSMALIKIQNDLKNVEKSKIGKKLILVPINVTDINCSWVTSNYYQISELMKKKKKMNHPIITRCDDLAHFSNLFESI